MSTSRTRRGRGPPSGSRARARWRRGAPRRPRPVGAAGRKATRVERSGSARADHLDPVGEELTAALGGGGGMVEAPGRPAVECGQKAGERRRGPPARVEPRGTGLRLEPAVRLVGGLREVARRRHRESLGVGDDESAGRVRPAEPLLAGDREVVEPRRGDGNRADRLGAVDEHGNARLVAEARARAGPGPSSRSPARARAAASAASPQRGWRPGSGATTTIRAPDVASAPSRPKCSSVVVTISSSGPSPSPPSTMLQPSVVLVVSVTWSGSAPTNAAMRARTCSRSSITRAKFGPPLRPSR